MNKLKHAVYVGEDCGWNLTKGESALIKDSDKEGKVLAQFDSFYLLKGGKDLCYGWHEFNESDFEVDEYYREEDVE